MGRSASKEQNVPPQFLKPQGVYKSYDWEDRTLRKLILSKKLSPFFPPPESKSEDNEECPICLMCYAGGLNRSACCQQSICSECYLQVRKNPRDYHAECPFCKTRPYNITYKGPKTSEEKFKEQMEEQKVIELQLKMRLEEEEKERKRLNDRLNNIAPQQQSQFLNQQPNPRIEDDEEESEDGLQHFYQRMLNQSNVAQPPAPYRPSQPSNTSLYDQSQQYQQERQASFQQNQNTFIQTQRPPLRHLHILPSPPAPRISQSDYIPSTIGGVNINDEDVDYEELMLREAIRLSMQDVSQQSSVDTSCNDSNDLSAARSNPNINIINNNIIINSENLDFLNELFSQPNSTQLASIQRANSDNALDNIDLEFQEEPSVRLPTSVRNSQDRDDTSDRPLSAIQQIRRTLTPDQEEEEDEELKAAIALSLLIQ
jgi:hypothetical protein